MNFLAAAMRALYLGFFEIGDVMVLGEFPVAVCAVESVLRHGRLPRQHDSAASCG